MSLGTYAAFPGRALASWAVNGNAAAIAAQNQTDAQMTSDGAGGVIVVWEDYRGGTGHADIYAQRFDPSGAPLWGNGVPVSTAAFGQQAPVICSNGQGGAIIAWQDVRGGSEYDIYAQALNSSGTRLWAPADGVLICGAVDDQTLEVITSDGAGGAIIAWKDQRSTSLIEDDIYVQRVSGGGVPRWTADGLAVCTFGGNQTDVTILSDQRGGAFIAWRDARNGSSNNDIYAQAMDSTGAVRPGWTVDGTAICSATAGQTEPALTSDGRYGFIITWLDTRTPGTGKIYAQRMRPDGSAAWTANGIEVGGLTAATPAEPIAVTDGLAGAIIGWTELRAGLPLRGYAQRIDSLGTRQWSPLDGVTLCASDSAQALHAVVPDKLGGAIFAWTDERGAGNDDEIRAQALSAAGSLRWAPLGVPVAATNGARSITTAIPDGYGGAYFGWQDFRSGDFDVYAFRLTSVGTGVESQEAPRTQLRLFPARPNPFNPHTTLEFSLETPADFDLSIHDVQGRLVRRVAAGWRSAGRHAFTWDGRTDRGVECGSGTYFAALRTPLGVRSIPITLIR